MPMQASCNLHRNLLPILLRTSGNIVGSIYWYKSGTNVRFHISSHFFNSERDTNTREDSIRIRYE